MKQYTTPTFTIKITSDDADVEQILADAKRIIVTARRGRKYSSDYDAEVDGDTVTFQMTQEDTGAVGGEDTMFEVTVVTQDNRILKTTTMYKDFEEAVRKKVLDVK